MSYEGTEQQICEAGHLTEVDCYDAISNGAAVCCVMTDFRVACGKKIVVFNAVDDTNGHSAGHVDFEQFLTRPAQMCECSACGNAHAVAPALYRIPSQEELQAARKFYDEEKGWLPLAKLSELPETE